MQGLAAAVHLSGKQSMDHYALRQWLDHWRQCAELSENEISHSMYTELVEPFRTADPVFSSNVAKELTFSPYSEQISRILSVPSHSKKRVLVCEILFNICKCTNHECRLFLASQLPILLWTEWALDREALGLEEDLSAIEVALLAAFQQDLNIEASAPHIRIPDITKKTIYNEPAVDRATERFPYQTGKETIITPDPSMYPSRPVTKIDEYSRVIVLYRLSRLMLDNLPSLPVSSQIAYCFLIERMGTAGTRMANIESIECLRKIMQNALPAVMAQDNQSMLSLLQFELQESSLLERNPAHVTEDSSSAGLAKENIDFEWLLELFVDPSFDAQNRRFPSSSPLYLLWANVLTAISFQFPGLVTIVRKQLLRRARYELLPLAAIALS